MTNGFAQVDRRLDRLEDRVDNLDRDVHAITRRLQRLLAVDLRVSS